MPFIQNKRCIYIYICFVSVLFKDPPVVTMLHGTFIEDNNIREIKCTAQGEPDSYYFLPWENRSQFDEHIRYIDGTDDGILQLPEVNVLNKYQDSGIYIGNVSNGIPDYRGNVYQHRIMHIVSKGNRCYSCCQNKQISLNS